MCGLHISVWEGASGAWPTPAFGPLATASPGGKPDEGAVSPAGPPQDFSCIIQKCVIWEAASLFPEPPPPTSPHTAPPPKGRMAWGCPRHPPAPFPAGRRHSLSVWPQPPLIQPSCSEQTPDLWKVKLHPEPARPTATAPSRSGQSRRQGGGQGPWGHSGHCPSAVMESSQMVCELRQLRFPLRSRL